MGRGNESSADPLGSPKADLANVLTGLRAQLDAAIGDFEAVRAEAEAKVLALHSHLKQISTGMSTLEAAISGGIAASDQATGATEAAEAAGDENATDEAAGEEKTAKAAASASEVAAETAGHSKPAAAAHKVTAEIARRRPDAEGVSENQPADDHAVRKEPATAADIAAAMLQDLALDSPASHSVSEPTTPAGVSVPPPPDIPVQHQATQSSSSSHDRAILEQEFAEYFEPAAVLPPAPRTTEQLDDAKKIATDDWA